MREFFKGWRRKTGIVTLMTALTFLCGYIRSHSVMDLASLRTSATTAHLLVSDPDGIAWIGVQDSDGDGVPDHDIYLGQKAEPSGVLGELDIEWKWELCGFQVGKGKEKVTDWGGNFGDGSDGGEKMLPTTQTPFVVAFVVVPYWSVILVMTLLSGYLLLTKYPASNQKKNTELTKLAARSGL